MIFNNLPITNVFKGSANVSEIFLGTTLVWGDVSIPDDEVWYTTSDNQPITLSRTNWLISGITYANVVSHTYTDKGVIKFDKPPVNVPNEPFRDYEKITSLILPNKITNIEGQVLWGADELTKLVLPRHLERLGSGAFGYCGFSFINLPSSLEFLGQGALRANKCKVIVLPNNLKTTDMGFLLGCVNLKRVHIPASLESLGADSLEGCLSLDNVVYEGTMEQWNQIELGYAWYGDGSGRIPASVVHCTDGDVPIGA